MAGVAGWPGWDGDGRRLDGVVDEQEFLNATLPAMDLVYNVARRAVPRREDAEDLVQETYLAAFRAWRDRRRPDRVEPWLATICLNLARSGYRARARRPKEVPWEEPGQDEPVLDSAAVSGADPEAQALAMCDRRMLHRALWRLSEEQRLAVALVDLSGFTTTEAARILGVPKGTVLSRLHRGRRALAARLRDPAEEAER